MEKLIVEDTKYIYTSPYGNLRIDTCRLPNGVIFEYNVCEYPDWVDIVAINENHELVLVKQYRHGAGILSLEIVAGSVENDEAPEDAVVRELQEETGYICLSKPILLGRFHHNPARQNNMLNIFFCDNIERTHEQNLDDTEDIEVVHVPFDQVDELICNSSITHLSSVTAIKLAEEYLQRSKAQNV